MPKEKGPKENRKSLGQGEEAVSQKMVESDDTPPVAQKLRRGTETQWPHYAGPTPALEGVWTMRVWVVH